jgi:hypothetical protein
LIPRNVFLSSHPRVTFAGEEDLDGRPCIRYDYKHGLIGSGYRLRVGSATASVAYRGSFWVDADTLDLVRLEFHADGIPPQIQLHSIGTVLTYERVHIGGSGFLLPSRSVTTALDLFGNESRNETRFSNCHQYTGESVISWGPPPPAAREPAATPAARIELPAGLRLDLALKAAISDEDSEVGDTFTAVVHQGVKWKKKIVVPAGAVATGRLVHLQRVTGPVPFCLVGLRIESLEFGGKHATVVAELEGFRDVSRRGFRLYLTPSFNGAESVDTSRLESLPGVDVVYAEGSPFRLPPGTRMIWRTTEQQ